MAAQSGGESGGGEMGGGGGVAGGTAHWHALYVPASVPATLQPAAVTARRRPEPRLHAGSTQTNQASVRWEVGLLTVFQRT